LTLEKGNFCIKLVVAFFPLKLTLSSSDRKSTIEYNSLSGNTSKNSLITFSEVKYQKYLPFMPLAIEQPDVSKHDIILSSSHAVAKGIITGPDQLHISYIHSPIRYAWDLQHQYIKEAGLDKGMKGMVARWLLHKIRLWDCRTSNGVDHFIANSEFIS
ncbi:glycosyltransferase family 4 protein, partial [Klebsiella pneumoniae]